MMEETMNGLEVVFDQVATATATATASNTNILPGEAAGKGAAGHKLSISR